ncbi:hypothetical protein R6Q59_001624, partial [Mikania micrantha]
MSAIVRFIDGSIEQTLHRKCENDVVVMKGQKIVWNLSKSERIELGASDFLFTSARDWNGDCDTELDEDLANVAANLRKEVCQ